MKKNLYSGRSVQDLKELIPFKSTFGDAYVYATEEYVVAAIFTRVGEGSITFRLSASNGKYILQELIPNAFKCLYDHPISIYKVSSKTFKKENIKSTINEFMSKEKVKVLEERKFESGLTLLKSLEEELELIYYSDNFDCSYLIDKQINYKKEKGENISKDIFEKVIFYHPNLITTLAKYGYTYSNDEVINIYEKYIDKYFNDKIMHNFLESALIQLKKYNKDLYDALHTKK